MIKFPAFVSPDLQPTYFKGKKEHKYEQIQQQHLICTSWKMTKDSIDKMTYIRSPLLELQDFPGPWVACISQSHSNLLQQKANVSLRLSTAPSYSPEIITLHTFTPIEWFFCNTHNMLLIDQKKNQMLICFCITLKASTTFNFL